MNRILISSILLFLIFSISFSLDFDFTKDFNSKYNLFKDDIIELKNYDYGSDCRFNFTVGSNQVINSGYCDQTYTLNLDLNYGKYSSEIIEFNASNTSQSNVINRNVHIVACKGFPSVKILNDSSVTPNKIAIWPNIKISNFTCEDDNINTTYISSNETFSNGSITSNSLGLKDRYPFSTTILFNSNANGKIAQLNVTLCRDNICNYNSTISQSYKIDNCKSYAKSALTTPSKLCPGSKYKLSFSFPSFCLNSNIELVVENTTTEYIHKYLNSQNINFNNLVVPNQPNDGLKFYTNISTTYKNDVPWKFKYYLPMNDWIGIQNATNISKINVNFDCYEKNEIPVPCGYSYVINTSLNRSITNSQSLDKLKDLNYVILMNVTFPNGYVDQYAKEVNGIDNYTTFGFDGYTNETCNYTFFSDLKCYKSGSDWICESKDIGDTVSFPDKVCPIKKVVYNFPCPAPTILKKWKDVNTISAPLHFTFGIDNERNPNEKQNYIFDISSSITNLFRLGAGTKVHYSSSSEITINLKVFRYVYNWSITPFNWLVSVFSKKDYIPIRIGFNQIQLQNLNGIGKTSSVCHGNSTCYTEVPMCGDGVCDYTAGENCKTCAKDCACGINTKGCYGQYVKDFTDQRGCIVRFKQYEEPCTFNDECDASKGLICDHNYVKGEYHVNGHCCKPGEIWDPNTVNLNDANPNINGTCRVARGVHIESISIHDFGNCPWSNCDFWGTVCGAKYTESISDTKIEIKVHTDYANDRVCAIFGTHPDVCCNGGIQFNGGATQYCQNANSNEVTFTFRMNDRAPHSGLWSGIERRCNNNEPMLIAVYLPYELDNSHSDYGSRILQEDFESKLHNYRGGGYITYQRSNKDVITTYDSDGDNWKSTFEPFNSWIYVNGHPGNILNDSNGNQKWAEIVEINNSGSNSCKNKNSAGWYMNSPKVIFSPSGDTPPLTSGRFVCGGRTMKPWNDW